MKADRTGDQPAVDNTHAEVGVATPTSGVLGSRAAQVVAVALLGIALGFVSAWYLPQGTALVTIPWGIAALLFGAFSRSRTRALLLGAVFGFLASYSYLWFDDTDPSRAGKMLGVALVILLPAAFGALCGAGAAWIGGLLGRVPRRSRPVGTPR